MTENEDDPCAFYPCCNDTGLVDGSPCHCTLGVIQAIRIVVDKEREAIVQLVNYWPNPFLPTGIDAPYYQKFAESLEGLAEAIERRKK